MSENQPGSSAPDSIEASGQDDKTVSQKAYEDVTKDMHKFKSQKKEMEMKNAELEAQLRSIQETQMRENDQYKELSEKYKAEVEAERSLRIQEEQKRLGDSKRTALKQELGGINDTYLVHADLNNIDVGDDGSIDKDSLLRVANKFRQEHSVLVPSGSSANATSYAASSNRTVSEQQPKTLGEMTKAEKFEAMRQIRLAKLNQ